jgi:hypothetical protein
MKTKEQELIDEFKFLARWGHMTQSELDWCSGAVRNRHDLTPHTKNRLRDSVQVILDRAVDRWRSSQDY